MGQTPDTTLLPNTQTETSLPPKEPSETTFPPEETSETNEDVTTESNDVTTISSEMSPNPDTESVGTTSAMKEPATSSPIVNMPGTISNVVDNSPTTMANSQTTVANEETTVPQTKPTESSLETSTGEQEVTTLSNRVGTTSGGMNAESGNVNGVNSDVTTPVMSVNNGDVTTISELNNDGGDNNDGSEDTNPNSGNNELETTTPAVVDTSPTSNEATPTSPNTGTEGVTPANKEDGTNPPSFAGITEPTPGEMVVDQEVTNKIQETTTISVDTDQITTVPSVVTINSVQGSNNGNADLPTTTQVETTPANKNEKLSTIVEVTVLPPSTVNPQGMGDSDMPTTEGGLNETNPPNGDTNNSDSNAPTNPSVDEDNAPTTLPPTTGDIPTTSNSIVFNTTPANKNDKLSTIVEVSVPSTETVAPPPSTESAPEVPTENPVVVPEIGTTELIDTTVPVRATTEAVNSEASVDMSGPVVNGQPSADSNAEPTVESNTQPSADLNTQPNEDSSTQPNAESLTTSPNGGTNVNDAVLTDAATTITPNITLPSESNPSQPLETLEPASSMDTLVKLEPNQLKPEDHVGIINNIVEDSLVAYMSGRPGDSGHPGAYIETAKPNKAASVVLNYDYLNPDNFQDYVNTVDRVGNGGDADFADILTQVIFFYELSRVHGDGRSTI